jgi:uncharacterized protein
MSVDARLDPKIRLVWIAAALIPAMVSAAITVGLLLVDVPIAPWITGAVATLIAVLGVTFVPARYRSWTYLLTDTELVVRYGVVSKTERWLPRTRVQHVDIIGGPLERMLGLRHVVVYTAGTRVADLSIPGLSESAAEGLRDDMLSWSKPHPTVEIDIVSEPEEVQASVTIAEIVDERPE